MATYGRTLLSTTGRTVEVAADGHPEWKVAGITLDWSTVAAVSGSDATFGDGTVVKVGQKGLQYGTILTKITASGKFGPADTTALDGRQTLALGECYILNETVLENGPDPLGFGAGASDHPAVIAGGRVWAARLQAGVGNQPTLANVLAVMPRLVLVRDE